MFYDLSISKVTQNAVLPNFAFSGIFSCFSSGERETTNPPAQYLRGRCGSSHSMRRSPGYSTSTTRSTPQFMTYTDLPARFWVRIVGKEGGYKFDALKSLTNRRRARFPYIYFLFDTRNLFLFYIFFHISRTRPFLRRGLLRPQAPYLSSILHGFYIRLNAVLSQDIHHQVYVFL